MVLGKPTLLSRKKIDAHGPHGGAPAQIPSLAPALVPAFGLASCPVGAAAALGPPMGSVLGYLESGVVDGLCSVREEDIVTEGLCLRCRCIRRGGCRCMWWWRCGFKGC
jgi:hypothetical protein